jgi:hypothetical protein
MWHYLNKSVTLFYFSSRMYCIKIKLLILNILWRGEAPRGRSIERPLLINGYAYLAVSLPDNGPVDSNS